VAAGYGRPVPSGCHGHDGVTATSFDPAAGDRESRRSGWPGRGRTAWTRPWSRRPRWRLDEKPLKSQGIQIPRSRLFFWTMGGCSTSKPEMGDRPVRARGTRYRRPARCAAVRRPAARRCRSAVQCRHYEFMQKLVDPWVFGSDYTGPDLLKNTLGQPRHRHGRTSATNGKRG